MWILLGVSSLIFIWFGLQCRYEEDMSRLLPSSGPSESGLVFGNLKVKDKIFLQFVPGADTGTETLTAAVDAFMETLVEEDSTTHYVANTLYRLDTETALNALDYALEHVPSFVPEDLYPAIDSAIARADETMQRNYDRVMEDETGAVTQMVVTDPLELRNLLLPDISGGVGYTLRDGHLFSADGTVALAFLSPNFQSFDSASGAKLVSRIEKAAERFRAENPDIGLLMHGAPVRAAGNSRIMKRDIALTIGLSLLLILIFLVLCFRSADIIWQNVAPVAYGTFFALACMYWIKGGMSLMALGIGSVVLGVALSYCLHVVVHHRFVGSIERMLSDESTPVVLGCLTTIGAFLGLLFTRSELLKDFGLFATFMLVGNTFFALVFLPHFLKEGDTRRNPRAFGFIARINGLPYDRQPVLLIALTVIILVGILFTPKVRFDNNLKHIGYEGESLLRSEALYAEKNADGGEQRYYAVAAPTLDEALADNQALTAVLDSLREKGVIARFTPVVSKLFQSEEQQQERIAAWKAYWNVHGVNALDEINRSARRKGLDPDMFLPFQALIGEEYEPGNLYESEIIPDGLLSNFIEESDGKYLIFNATQLPVGARTEVDATVTELPHTVVVDPFYYTGNMIDIIHGDFNTTLLISSLFVLLVLLVSFRNLVTALLAFLPMFLSWYVVQGWMAIFGLPFNLINIVISTFIFGIGVDYSIFVMQGLLSAARGKDDALLDEHKCAIFFSALVLVVVVCAMLAATHPAIRSIGISTLIGMVSTILITYSLQPFLFRQALKIPFLKKHML